MLHSRSLVFFLCIQHYTPVALMPENNCAVSRNASHTSLLPSVQKLWQFARHADARCRHYCWTATPPVHIVRKFLPSQIYALSKTEVLYVRIQSENGKNISLFGVISVRIIINNKSKCENIRIIPALFV